jgi:hypothetical protein
MANRRIALDRYGARPYQLEIQAVPTISTVLINQDVEISSIHIVNTTSASITFTITDNQSSPMTWISAQSIPANSSVVWSYAEPMHFNSGMKGSASASGLNIAVKGYTGT